MLAKIGIAFALPSPMVGSLQSSRLPGGTIAATNSWGGGNFTVNWGVEETAEGEYVYDYYLFVTGGGESIFDMILSTPIHLSGDDISPGSYQNHQADFFRPDDPGNVHMGLPSATQGIKFVFDPRVVRQHVRIYSGLGPVWGGFFSSVDPMLVPPMTVPTVAYSGGFGNFQDFDWGVPTFGRRDLPVPGTRPPAAVAPVSEPGSLALVILLGGLLFLFSQRRRAHPS